MTTYLLDFQLTKTLHRSPDFQPLRRLQQQARSNSSFRQDACFPVQLSVLLPHILQELYPTSPRKHLTQVCAYPMSCVFMFHQKQQHDESRGYYPGRQGVGLLVCLCDFQKVGSPLSLPAFVDPATGRGIPEGLLMNQT